MSFLSKVLKVGVITLVAAACNPNAPLVTNTSATPPDAAGAPSFAQFNDIPVPEGASMNIERTVVFGDNEAWTGRLALTSSYAQTGMFDFYKIEMPKFGWQEVTSVRAANSVQTFKRGTRVATIQISTPAIGSTLGGSEVDFTVSPEGSAPSVAAGSPGPTANN